MLVMNELTIWDKIKSHPARIFVVGLVVVAVFSIGYIFGRNTQQVVHLDDGRIIGIGEAQRIANDVNFNLFWEVWEMVQDDHLRGPASEKDLFYGAINGLVEGIGDPYSDFFDPREADQFEADLEGKFEGIGAEIGIRDEQLVIVSPLSGSPAENAGILAGDKIYFIDGVDTRGMAIDEAVGRIRGQRESIVVLTVSHDGIQEVEDISIKRDVIELSSVEWEIDEDGVAVIQISLFNEDKARNFNNAVL